MGNRLQTAQTTMRNIERKKAKAREKRRRWIQQSVHEKIKQMTMDMEADQMTKYTFRFLFSGYSEDLRAEACRELVRTLEKLCYHVKIKDFEVTVYVPAADVS